MLMTSCIVFNIMSTYNIRMAVSMPSCLQSDSSISNISKLPELGDSSGDLGSFAGRFILDLRLVGSFVLESHPLPPIPGHQEGRWIPTYKISAPSYQPTQEFYEQIIPKKDQKGSLPKLWHTALICINYISLKRTVDDLKQNSTTGSTEWGPALQQRSTALSGLDVVPNFRALKFRVKQLGDVPSWSLPRAAGSHCWRRTCQVWWIPGVFDILDFVKWHVWPCLNSAPVWPGSHTTACKDQCPHWW